jgi:hypothetical protein
MARNAQLSRLVSALRAELGRSTNISTGVDDIEGLKQTLQRTQETLYDDYDWPFLRQVFTPIPLSAGQRYYDFPANLNFERIEEVAFWFNLQPIKAERGIGFENYRIFNSDSDIRSDPAQRWDVRWDDTKEQIEVWPVPSGSGQTLQFIGIRKLRPLVDNNDVADLDDKLIVLFAAAELLARQKSADAQLKLAAAQQRYARIKSRMVGGSSSIRLGMGRSTAPPLNRATVRIAGMP